MDAILNQQDRPRKCIGPFSVSAYRDPKYWDERFSNEERYEWLKDYYEFRHLVQPHLDPNFSILELGCGNSRLSEELYKDGITKITCIDLSAVAVENKKKRLLSRGLKDIEVLEADMLDLPFSDEAFDAVIEKGTMDVLFVDSGDLWNPRPATPLFRRPFVDTPEFTWSPEWNTFGDGFHYLSYILKKGKRSSDGERAREKYETPSICLLQDELESEDYIFRTNIEKLNCYCYNYNLL